ncbi:MAG: ABC transporter permease [Acidimicrobiia bacterium]|nr:ABC transporter permease [Acidimicrobiia bacterium]
MPATSLAPKRVVRAARNYFTDLWSRREFAWYLAMGNLKARNASTALGLLWWVLNPVLLGAVYWFVFGLLFDRDPDEFGGLPFVVYLLSGMFPFYFTQTSMTGGVNSIVNNTQLLANLNFPRAVLPIAALVEGFVGFLTSLLAFFIIVGPANGLIVGFDQAVWPDIDILWLLPIMVIHLMFNLGVSMLVARLAVPFRDLNNLVPYFTRMWLYLSPILYGPVTLAKAPDWARAIAEANPLEPLLRLYRHALTPLDTDLSNAFLGAGLWALVLLVVGGLSFIRYEGKMARYL